MTLTDHIKSLASAIGRDTRFLRDMLFELLKYIGSLPSLTTKNKTNLVNAVNEVNTEIKNKVHDGSITTSLSFSDIARTASNSSFMLWTLNYKDTPVFYFKHKNPIPDNSNSHDRFLLFKEGFWKIYTIHPTTGVLTLRFGQTPVIDDDIESLTTTLSSTKIKGLLANLTSNSVNTNSIKVGVNSPAIAYKTISGTTIPAQTNGITRIAHGLNFRKILDWRVLLESTSSRLIEGNNDRNEEYYQVTVDATFFNLKYVGSIIATATEIQNRPVKIFITYEV